MKKVREHINEKFTENSDPIADLGIGGFEPKKYLENLLKPVQEQFIEYLLTTVGHRLKGKFRTVRDINSKKYNLITGKIKSINYLYPSGDDTLLRAINDIAIYFVDEEDNDYYYYFKDAEKFYVEE